MPQAKHQCLLTIMGWLLSTAWLNAASLHQTQHQISQLNRQMGQLEHTISYEMTHQQKLHQTLHETEKQLAKHQQKQHDLDQQIQHKKHEVTQLQSQHIALEEQLKHQKESLAHLLQLHYQTARPQPWQWFFNQQTSRITDRNLTYHHYLVQANIQALKTIESLEQTVLENQRKQHIQLKALASLETQLHEDQHQLDAIKTQRQNLLNALNSTINQHRTQLAHYKSDQARLQALLHELIKASMAEARSIKRDSHHSASPVILPKSLAMPVNHAHVYARAMKQGAFFAAPEGTTVTAVLPGKIVFSDWLNGYGLLIIVDHGNGMMSLYAHNESLYKPRGTWVKTGDPIATIGHTGGISENGLYFELRRRGKVVPPRQWLA